MIMPSFPVRYINTVKVIGIYTGKYAMNSFCIDTSGPHYCSKTFKTKKAEWVYMRKIIKEINQNPNPKLIPFLE